MDAPTQIKSRIRNYPFAQNGNGVCALPQKSPATSCHNHRTRNNPRIPFWQRRATPIRVFDHADGLQLYLGRQRRCAAGAAHPPHPRVHQLAARHAGRQGKSCSSSCSPTAVSVLDLAPYTGPGGRHFGANTYHSSQQLLGTLSDAMRSTSSVWTKLCIMVTLALPCRHVRDQRIRRLPRAQSFRSLVRRSRRRGSGQSEDIPRPHGGWQPVQRQRRWPRGVGVPPAAGGVKDAAHP